MVHIYIKRESAYTNIARAKTDIVKKGRNQTEKKNLGNGEVKLNKKI